MGWLAGWLAGWITKIGRVGLGGVVSLTASSHSKSSQALSNVGRYVYKVSCYNGLTRRRRGIGWAELGWAGCFRTNGHNIKKNERT